ncbi:MAG TPA: type II toxin-antitoxin system RelE/ParE family toxin [Nitrospirae bacterium]|nr:type II toxin-antitoxin system RelE/ParE family toxin [Nitrospirota bacterium]HDL20362.1 type II toxin-antitoxin system RelE/ParE family toxin [Nitrospirota bacterium]HDZ01241.1 type II toxin-antitoxin system RelE/ParE family toxin [Nitrospirota bacterium]
MVRWSFPAKEDLRRIHDYIAIDSKFYAKKISQDIVEKTEKLNDFPKCGRVVPETGDPNIREIIIYSYRLVYEIYPTVTEILGIIHGKQDFSSAEFNTLRK